VPSWIRYRIRRGPSPEVLRREKQQKSWKRLKAQVEEKYKEKP